MQRKTSSRVFDGSWRTSASSSANVPARRANKSLLLPLLKRLTWTDAIIIGGCFTAFNTGKVLAAALFS